MKNTTPSERTKTRGEALLLLRRHVRNASRKDLEIIAIEYLKEDWVKDYGPESTPTITVTVPFTNIAPIAVQVTGRVEDQS